MLKEENYTNNCGVYKITNIINGKVYIGKSINIKSRWDGHKNDLKNNKHHSFHLQKAYNKYGKNSFKHEILVSCSPEYYGSIENKFINIYESDNRKYGYNIITNENKFPEESRNKLKLSINNSEIFKKSRFESWKNRIRRKVNQYDLNGSYIKTFNSITELSINLNICKSTIYKVCNENYKTYSLKNYMYRFYNDDISNITPYDKYKHNPNLKGLYKSNTKITKPILKVLCYDKNMNFIKEFDNCSIAARELNIDSSCIAKCCKGKIKYYKTFIFKNKK